MHNYQTNVLDHSFLHSEIRVDSVGNGVSPEWRLVINLRADPAGRRLMG